MEITLDDLIIPKYDALLDDVLDHEYTHYTLYGGRGSTKSSFISIAIILLITQNSNLHAVVFRKMGNTLRDSVYSQISFAISILQLDAYFKRTVSPMEITYLPTGQKILFRGIDEPEKIKSIKAPFGNFGITWFEELDQYHGREEIRTVLQSTMRGKGGKFWNFESFNPPISRNNWANMDLLQTRPDRLIIKTNYLDVPVDWLSEQFFTEAELLKETNPRAYEHEYMGEAVGTGGNVFENVKTRDITDDELSQFDRLYYGLDWGYYPDPYHFAEMQYSAAQRSLYIYREKRAWKSSNENTARELADYKGVQITADSAEPKSVADFRAWGFNMQGAIKGPNSVDYSMKWLQSLNEIIIDPARCPYTASEFLSYEYERNKDNEVISGYPDRDNHSIDAVRYAMESVWRMRGK